MAKARKYLVKEFQEISKGESFRYNGSWFTKTGRWWGMDDLTEDLVEVADMEVVAIIPA